MGSDTYLTIKAHSEGLYKEKGSRFLSFAYPVFSSEEIKPHIESIRKEHHGARHHCYAFMLGQQRDQWRVNDDGEPSGTAGKPILGQINSLGLTNILVVVTRYFGGKLLGVSGLINAYKTAAGSALANAVITELTVNEYYDLIFPYSSMNEVMKLIKEEKTGQSGQQFGDECRISINFRESDREKVLSLLGRIEGLRYNYIKTL
jgi:uncharacterized YigZ family protein